MSEGRAVGATGNIRERIGREDELFPGVATSVSATLEFWPSQMLEINETEGESNDD